MFVLPCALFIQPPMPVTITRKKIKSECVSLLIPISLSLLLLISLLFSLLFQGKVSLNAKLLTCHCGSLWSAHNLPMYISNFCTPPNFRRQTSPLLLVCMLSLQSCPTLQPYGLWPARLLCPWDIQARILKWVAISSSRGSSQPRDQTYHASYISSIGRQVLYH